MWGCRSSAVCRRYSEDVLHQFTTSSNLREKQNKNKQLNEVLFLVLHLWFLLYCLWRLVFNLNVGLSRVFLIVVGANGENNHIVTIRTLHDLVED